MNILDTIGQTTIDKVQAERPVPRFEPGDTLQACTSRCRKATASASRSMKACASARKNAGVNSSFTVRKISFGEGVERVFPLYGPGIWEIEVVRKGVVRRAKLYYLRDLRGKASRIAEDTEAQRELLAVQAEEAIKRPRREKIKKEKPKDERQHPRRQGRRQEVGASWRSARRRPRRHLRRPSRAPCSRRSGMATSSIARTTAPA